MTSRGEARDWYRVTRPFSAAELAAGVAVTVAVAGVVVLGGLLEGAIGAGNIVVIFLLVPIAMRYYLRWRTALMVAPNGLTVGGKLTPWPDVQALVVESLSAGDAVETVQVGVRRRGAEAFVARAGVELARYDKARLQAAFTRFAPTTATLSGWGFDAPASPPTATVPLRHPPRRTRRRLITLVTVPVVLLVSLGALFGVRHLRDDDHWSDDLFDRVVVVRATEPVSSEGSGELDMWVDDVAEVHGVAQVAPYLMGTATFVSDPATGEEWPAAVSTWFGIDRLDVFEIDAGRAPEHVGEVVIDARAARDRDLDVGDPLGINAAEGDVVVSGTARYGPHDDLCGGSFVLFSTYGLPTGSLPEAERGMFVVPEDGVTMDELAHRLTELLPGKFDVEALERTRSDDRWLPRCPG